eukprot:maker-scaffold419_size176504-snap-gene-0.36 protein:Tk02019 transcript:maker-scaffold419_size176504-snap-gene-0.36-mRNA-1 annotation:"nuclear valosin-containing isoform x3"
MSPFTLDLVGTIGPVIGMLLCSLIIRFIQAKSLIQTTVFDLILVDYCRLTILRKSNLLVMIHISSVLEVVPDWFIMGQIFFERSSFMAIFLQWLISVCLRYCYVFHWGRFQNILDSRLLNTSRLIYFGFSLTKAILDMWLEDLMCPAGTRLVLQYPQKHAFIAGAPHTQEMVVGACSNRTSKWEILAIFVISGTILPLLSIRISCHRHAKSLQRTFKPTARVTPIGSISAIVPMVVALHPGIGPQKAKSLVGVCGTLIITSFLVSGILLGVVIILMGEASFQVVYIMVHSLWSVAIPGIILLQQNSLRAKVKRLVWRDPALPEPPRERAPDTFLVATSRYATSGDLDRGSGTRSEASGFWVQAASDDWEDEDWAEDKERGERADFEAALDSIDEIMADFIPLETSAHGHKKKKRKHKDPPESHQAQVTASPGSESGGPATKKSYKGHHASSASSSRSYLLDHKLKPRIRDYLEKNRDKQYIDIDEMSASLHAHFPEYSRKKLREFRRQVEECFERLQNEAAAERSASPPDDEVAEVMSRASPVSKPASPQTTPAALPRIEAVQSMAATLNGLYSKSQGPASNGSGHHGLVSAEDVDDAITVVGVEAAKRPLPAFSKPQTDFERVQAKAAGLAHRRPGPLSKRTPKTSRAGSIRGGGDSDNESMVAKVHSPRQVVDLVDEEPAPKLPEPVAFSSRPPNGLDTPRPKLPPPATPVTQPAMGGSGLGKKSKRREPLPLAVAKATFADVGGVEGIVYDVFQMTRHLRCPQFFRQLSVLPPRGCILHGPPGCGKTLLANAISGELQIPMLTVAGTELVSGVSGESEAKIREVFEQAKASAPCILFIDGIDVIAKKRENAQRDMEMRIVSQLLSSMDDLNSAGFEAPGQVFVLGATSRLETLDPALRIGERLEREIAMGIPDEKARLHILTVMCRQFFFESEFDFNLLARLTPGYVGSDLKALIKAAASFAEDRHFRALETSFLSDQGLDRTVLEKSALFQWCNESDLAQARLCELKIEFGDFHAALKVVQPSALREGFATVPNVTFEDIGALDEIREELEMAICAPVNDPEMIARLGMDGPSGVLLCGPPGCGKTLLAKAVANQAGINFISIKGPEIINMYVGESERAIRQVFQRARNSAPCVIFFDEIDSICPRRSGSDSGSGSNRVVNQLLTEMDGVEARKGVYVMGATNRMDMIDPAVLRPGRLTNHFFVDLPCANGRADILKKLTKNGTRPALAEDVDLDAIAQSKRCAGLSGADLGKLVTRAAHFRFKEYCQEKRLGQGLASTRPEDVQVSGRHFEQAFDVVLPSVSGLDKKRYDQLKRKYLPQRPNAESEAAMDTGPALADVKPSLTMSTIELVRAGSPDPPKPLSVTTSNHSEMGEPLIETIPFKSDPGSSATSPIVSTFGDQEMASDTALPLEADQAPIAVNGSLASSPRVVEEASNKGTTGKAQSSPSGEKGSSVRRSTSQTSHGPEPRRPKGSVKSAEKATAKPGDKLGAKSAEKVGPKPAEMVAAKPGVKVTAKSTDKVAAKSTEKVATKSTDKVAAKSAEKATARSGDKATVSTTPSKGTKPPGSRPGPLSKTIPKGSPAKPVINRTNLNRSFETADGFRFLDGMVVRVNNIGHPQHGFEGVIKIVEGENNCTLQNMPGNRPEEFQAPMASLEPFTPSLGESAKLLLKGERRDVGQVVKFSQVNDDVTITFFDETEIEIGLDHLCKVLSD